MKIYQIFFKVIIPTVVSLNLTSCLTGSDKIFQIKDSNRDGFIFMVESVNVLELPSDSLTCYLTHSEIKEMGILDSLRHLKKDFVRQVTYKNYGIIYESSNFKVYILLKINNMSKGRDYRFIVRTYKHNMQIIDSYDLAIWNKDAGRFCFGSINKRLIIERKCIGADSRDIMQILDDGMIVATSFHQP